MFDYDVRPGGDPGWGTVFNASARPEFGARLAHDHRILGNAGYLDGLNQKPGFRRGYHEGGLPRRTYSAGWRRRCRQVHDRLGGQFHHPGYRGGCVVYSSVLLHGLIMSSASQEPMIRVENLTTYYGERRILDCVNLDVQAGETLVILGGSGTGKSTLL